MIKTRFTASALVLLLILGFAGCAVKNQTPQYNAAIGINDFSHALKGFQDIEIAAHQANFVPEADHQAIEKAVLEAFQYDAAAEAADKSGDLVTAKSKYMAALILLQNINPQMVGIKNPASQQAMQAALAVAVAIARDWAGGVQ